MKQDNLLISSLENHVNSFLNLSKCRHPCWEDDRLTSIGNCFEKWVVCQITTANLESRNELVKHAKLISSMRSGKEEYALLITICLQLSEFFVCKFETLEHCKLALFFSCILCLISRLRRFCRDKFFARKSLELHCIRTRLLCRINELFGNLKTAIVIHTGLCYNIARLLWSYLHTGNFDRVIHYSITSPFQSAGSLLANSRSSSGMLDAYTGTSSEFPSIS